MNLKTRSRLITFWVTAAIFGCRVDDGSSRNPQHAPNALIFLVAALRAGAVGGLRKRPRREARYRPLCPRGDGLRARFCAKLLDSTVGDLHPYGSLSAGRDSEGCPVSRSALLPEVFRKHGYRTGFLVTNPNVGTFFGYSRDFDDFFEFYGRRQGAACLHENSWRARIR